MPRKPAPFAAASCAAFRADATPRRRQLRFTAVMTFSASSDAGDRSQHCVADHFVVVERDEGEIEATRGVRELPAVKAVVIGRQVVGRREVCNRFPMDFEQLTLGAGTVCERDDRHAGRWFGFVRLAGLEVEPHELEAIDLREPTVLQECERRLVVSPGGRVAHGFPERAEMARQLAVERSADSFASVLRHDAE